MPCTTILVGKKASWDGSTMIARNEDFNYQVKKMVIVEPKDQPRKYKTVISHLEIDLPDDPMRYSASPNVSRHIGTWAGSGINACGVGITATETLTTNPRVLAADPFVVYKKAEKRGEKDVPGGIGEEDLVVITLPYVHTAREAVKRLGELHEKYGTYEMNGVGLNDENEVWWFETIGGHHWMARRVKDEEVVIMPNQLGIDDFDLEDAFGKQEYHMCSADLKEFIEENHLDLNLDGKLNPRNVFGSHSDNDHIYNTPRGWFMARYFMPHKYKWDGPDADFTPESDDIPWSFVPEKKVTVEDIKYVLSSHYQGTPYDPYSGIDYPEKGKYRCISVSSTAHTSIMQIRPWMPDAVKGVEWISFGSTIYNTMLPVYTNVPKLPAYLSAVTLDPSTDNFYWSSRMLEALADPHFGSCIQIVERYQNSVLAQGHAIIGEYDKKFLKTGDMKLLSEANEKTCAMGRKETTAVIDKVLLAASQKMKNTYNRSDY